MSWHKSSDSFQIPCFKSQSAEVDPGNEVQLPSYDGVFAAKHPMDEMLRGSRATMSSLELGR